MFFEEELLNSVMDRYYHEFDENTYRKISLAFIEEHLKLLKAYERKIKGQYEEVKKIMDNLNKSLKQEKVL